VITYPGGFQQLDRIVSLKAPKPSVYTSFGKKLALAARYGERQQDAQVISAAEVLHKIWPL